MHNLNWNYDDNLVLANTMAAFSKSLNDATQVSEVIPALAEDTKTSASTNKAPIFLQSMLEEIFFLTLGSPFYMCWDSKAAPLVQTSLDQFAVIANN